MKYIVVSNGDKTAFCCNVHLRCLGLTTNTARQDNLQITHRIAFLHFDVLTS